MSGAVDRLRRTVAAVVARPDDAIAVGYADVVAALAALDEYAHVERELQADRDAQRTRADAADRAAEGLRRELADARAECARLRAALDGDVPCTEQALDAIEAMSRRAVARESALRAERDTALAVVTAVRVERAAVASWTDVPTLETLRAVRRSETATDAALARVTP